MTNSNEFPTQTPNTVVSNPGIRKVAGNTLGVASIVLASAITLDGATPAFDISAWTVPAFVLVGFLAGVFQVGVTSPNVPSK